ncbi:hypothetical protein HAX54_028938 [Datura stramonium]|uniref:Uncharacterized protein n=1 Tax=Datura stramonium TaxID=4076 RepID=A0ABS8V769_DATST|nr:hypothetical protein [Datura stramonium]
MIRVLWRLAGVLRGEDNNCSAGNSATEPYIVGHYMLLAHWSCCKLYRKIQDWCEYFLRCSEGLYSSSFTLRNITRIQLFTSQSVEWVSRILMMLQKVSMMLRGLISTNVILRLFIDLLGRSKCEGFLHGHFLTILDKDQDTRRGLASIS